MQITTTYKGAHDVSGRQAGNIFYTMRYVRNNHTNHMGEGEFTMDKPDTLPVEKYFVSQNEKGFWCPYNRSYNYPVFIHGKEYDSEKLAKDICDKWNREDREQYEKNSGRDQLAIDG